MTQTLAFRNFQLHESHLFNPKSARAKHRILTMAQASACALKLLLQLNLFQILKAFSFKNEQKVKILG